MILKFALRAGLLQAAVVVYWEQETLLPMNDVCKMILCMACLVGGHVWEASLHYNFFCLLRIGHLLKS